MVEEVIKVDRRALDAAVAKGVEFEQGGDVAIQASRLLLRTVVIVSAVVLAGCSKSPVDAGIDALNSLGKIFMSGIMQKDASKQANGLILLLADRPECEIYKSRLREAGLGSPYEGATQWKLEHAYEDAGKAGCGKPQ
jgi:hypothetical protein